MPTVFLAPTFGVGWQGFTSGGLPLNGGLLNTYLAGSTTPQATYTTSAGNVQNANPIVLSSDGRPPNEIWLVQGVSYRFDLTDSLSTLIKTYDNISGVNDVTQLPVPWAVAGGTADAITAAYTPANTSLTDGLLLSYRASAANATATPTFSPDGLTAHVQTKYGGTALKPGDINANLAEIFVRYNLANTRWEILNPAAIFAPKVGSFTRDISTASGNQSITGVGFTPSAVMFFAGVSGTSRMSFGVDNATTLGDVGDDYVDSANTYAANSTNSIFLAVAAGANAVAKINSLDADGFTLAWTKTGAAVGTALITYIAFR